MLRRLGKLRLRGLFRRPSRIDEVAEEEVDEEGVLDVGSVSEARPPAHQRRPLFSLDPHPRDGPGQAARAPHAASRLCTRR